jgi:hypothetical protein
MSWDASQLGTDNKKEGYWMNQRRHESVEKEAPKIVAPKEFDPSQAVESITKLARENPHVALAGAVAIGFVLGGGMTPKLLGAIAMFVARNYFRATVEETFSSLQSTLEGQTYPNR